jgi:hypothetical protein
MHECNGHFAAREGRPGLLWLIRLRTGTARPTCTVVTASDVRNWVGATETFWNCIPYPSRMSAGLLAVLTDFQSIDNT